MLCKADKGQQLFSIKGSRFDRISEFSELTWKSMSLYSGILNEAGSPWWISE